MVVKFNSPFLLKIKGNEFAVFLKALSWRKSSNLLYFACFLVDSEDFSLLGAWDLSK